VSERQLDLEHEILEWLVVSDESPWIIHTEIRKHVDPEISVDALLEAIKVIEQRGWVEQRIPERNFTEALAEYRRYAASPRWRSRGLFAEYGPWYAITDAGRAEWQQLAT